jgi:hypothetical protein
LNKSISQLVKPTTPMTTQARPISETFAQAVANSMASADIPPPPGLGDMAKRPVSEMIPATGEQPKNPDTEAIDKWVDDLAHYEETMEQMAKASLDQNFKDELTAIEQWFQVLSDPERTATLYSLLQHTSRVQQGFFIAFLQQLGRKDNRPGADRGKDVKKLADAGRQRRLGNSKPQLAIAGTNEKYARMFGEEGTFSSPQQGAAPQTGPVIKPGKPGTTSAFMAARPRSAATATGMFPTDKPAFAQIVAKDAARARAAMDPSAYEDGGSMMGHIEGKKWQPMTPTFSTFSEIAKGIERPQSTNDMLISARDPRLAGKLSSAAVRSPLGPAGDNGFLARAQARGLTSAKLVQNPPLSAGMRALHSPAFPPGLFPSNPWAAAASPGLDKKTAASTAALKQKFATLIADSRADASKDAANAAAQAARLANGAALANAEPKSPKPVEPIDFKLLSDIPAWFRSMRLHKYTNLFETMKWQEIIQLDDEKLTDMGVAALGARRKMIKVFDQVKIEAAQKNVSIEMP